VVEDQGACAPRTQELQVLMLRSFVLLFYIPLRLTSLSL